MPGWDNLDLAIGVSDCCVDGRTDLLAKTFESEVPPVVHY